MTDGAVAAMTVRMLGAGDADALLALYRAVAAVPNAGLARTPDEMAPAYAESILARAAAGGISLGAFAGGTLVGEIHAFRPAPRQFAHVLSELTVAVAPGWQGRGVGRTLFAALFDAAATLSPRVRRIELLARSGNADAIRLYARLGFVVEGRLRERVRLADGTVEDDIAMARLLD